MPRPATGQIIERRGERGTTYALRFRAYGKRYYVTAAARTRAEAETELANILADVRRGIWRPPESTPAVEEPKPEPTFHEFASEWIAAREQEGLSERTIEDYRWALSYHLLPFFREHRLSEITVREVDIYKTAKAAEGVLSPNSINKTLTRLSQVLAAAVEYELIAANPAAGKRRRLKRTKPRRPWVEPEQLPTLLDVAGGKKPLLGGRGRPLIAVMAGAGLRVGEVMALERRDVNLARGKLTVRKSKTDAGVRIVDLTPAVRDELATYLASRPEKRPGDLFFPTLAGRKDNRNNIRRRLLQPAIRRANERLAELGIEPIDKVTPHGLRRTYASLRAAVGDDPAYTATQLGHEDPTFTLRVYTHAVKRRERLVGAEREEFTRAVEWAQWARMGTNDRLDTPVVAPAENGDPQRPHRQRRFG
jgi:integrase